MSIRRVVFNLGGTFFDRDSGDISGDLATATGLTAHLADTTDAHDASAVSIVDSGTYFTGTDVEAALQELGASGGGSGDVATDTIWDAKGDLAVGTGANTAAKLTAGSNGKVLTTDSGETTGLKWATPSGGSGLLVELYDFTITGSDQAAIDTFVDNGGAGVGAALSGAYDALEVYFLVRSDNAGAALNCYVTVNNNTGGNYDSQQSYSLSTTIGGSGVVAQTAWVHAIHGSGGTANYPGMGKLVIPAYASTTFYKIGQMEGGCPDGTAGNNRETTTVVGFRDTAAITRIAVTAGAPDKFKVGSRLWVYAR